MEHHHRRQLEVCSKIDPNRKVQHKTKIARMQLVVEDVNKKVDDFINNFRPRLKKIDYGQFAVKDVNKKADDFIDDFRPRLKKTAYGHVAVEDVNKKADDFINKFRRQLKFEREESLKRYRETIGCQKG